MLDDDERGPALAAQWFLQSLVMQPDAASFSAASLIHLLATEGFANPSSQILIPEITKIVVCEKPA
jgi:hypothetical protein